MRKLSYVLCVIALGAAMFAAGCAKKVVAPVFNTYTAPDGSFSVDLPGALKDMAKETQSMNTSVGERSMDFYSAQGNDVMYMAAVMKLELPEGATMDVNKGLEGGVKGVAGNGSILSQDLKFKVGEYPAALARIKKEAGGSEVYIQSLQVFANNTQYQLQAMAQKEATLDSPEVKHFIGSLKILGGKAAPALPAK